MTTTYLKCSECSGEIPFEIEWTDDGAADIYGAQSYPVAILDFGTNRTTHDDFCPMALLTPEHLAVTHLEQQVAQNYGYPDDND